ANEQWIELLNDIRRHGRPSKPRGLNILELVGHRTQVDMHHPIVSIAKRKLGYKFMCAEAHWVLSGKNDVASIAPYSKHISSFSNDGIRFDGAYGPRIIDQ